MTEKKVENIIYEDLGFPIYLHNTPMKKIFGEWVIDINMNVFQVEVLKKLIHQQSPLQAEHLRFIRKYFEMTSTAFGQVFGVSHAAVLKWERGYLPTPALDVYIRMFVMDKLKAKDSAFGRLYHEVNLDRLMQAKKEGTQGKPLSMNVRQRRFAHRRQSKETAS